MSSGGGEGEGEMSWRKGRGDELKEGKGENGKGKMCWSGGRGNGEMNWRKGRGR